MEQDRPTRGFSASRSTTGPLLVTGAALLVVVLVACGGGSATGTGGGGTMEPGTGPAVETAVSHPRVYDPARAAPPLPLVDQRGRPFRWSELHGRTVLVIFGYTHCPDVCPTTLAIAREVLRARPQEAAVVFVTVDPGRDTPAALGRFLDLFEVPMMGLSGTPEAVAEVLRAWGVTAVPGAVDSAGNYPVYHSTGTYLVDPQGRLRFLYPYGTSAGQLVEAVDQLAKGE